MKKIVFLWPFNVSYSTSVWFLELSKYIKRSGYDIKVIYSNLLFSDDNMSLPKDAAKEPKRSFENVVDNVKKHDPEIIFIGSQDNQNPHMSFIRKFCKRYKNIKSKTKLIIGGFIPTFLPEKTLSFTDADFVLKGDYKTILSKLINAIAYGNEIENIKGISFFKDEKYIFTGEPDKIDKAEKPEFIDYDDVLGNTPSRIDIRTSKGCLMNCGFCNLHEFWEKPVKYYSEEHVIKQIEHLKKRHDFNYIHIIDEMFLNKIKRAEVLSEKIHKKFPKLKWGAMIRNEFVSDDSIKTLARNGFSNTAVGIESNNPKILKFLNKSPNISNYISRIDYTLDILSKNIDVLEIGLIIGTPVESSNDIIDQIDLMKKIRAKKRELKTLRIALGKLRVDVGSGLWKKYQDKEISLIKENNFKSDFHKFFESDTIDLVWPALHNYSIKNNNFESQRDHEDLMNLAFREVRS
ncbi:MAG: B12-binding domain-containing radical SAM protein [Candidatus Woesearchaeota archaeon]